MTWANMELSPEKASAACCGKVGVGLGVGLGVGVGVRAGVELRGYGLPKSVGLGGSVRGW